MIYKFQSPATGDLFMNDQVVDRMLDILGRQPSATGIIESDAMPAAIQAIEAAIQAAADHEIAPVDCIDEGYVAEGPVRRRHDTVSLGRRAWPLLQMMRRACGESAPILWSR